MIANARTYTLASHTSPNTNQSMLKRVPPAAQGNNACHSKRLLTMSKDRRAAGNSG
jgi:hypothetical protein